MTTEILTPKHILQKIEEIYQMAVEKGQFAVALKVQELLGREAGLFHGKNNGARKISVDTLSDEDLGQLLKDLEAKFGALEENEQAFDSSPDCFL